MDKYEKLKELKTLLDNGVLNQDEFDKLKNEILFADDIEKIKDSGTANSFSKHDSIEKPAVERNIFEEIEFKNNQKTNFSSSPKVKTKSNNNLILFAVIVVIVLFIKFYISSDEREIKEICSDCKEFLNIRKTTWILVKNSENKSNVYDKKTHKFLLENWYEAKYDEGIVYDDITFQVNGNSKMCSEHDYHFLTEKGDDYLNSSLDDSNSTYSNSSSNNSSSSYSSDEKCSWCGKSFSGEHYTHLGKMSDCYSTSSSSSIGIYCSKSCCSQARRSSCPTCR